MPTISELRERVAKEIRTSGAASSQTRFDLAVYLVSSPNASDVEEGLALLKGLMASEGANRDYLYFTSQGYYALGRYDEAYRCVNKLLESEPRNQQALELKKQIDRAVQMDSTKGLVMAAGAVALGAVAVGLLSRALSRR